MAARGRQSLWPWLLVLVASLAVSGGILWDVWPAVRDAAVLRASGPVEERAAPARPPGSRRIRLMLPEGAEGALRERRAEVEDRPLLREDVQLALAALQREAKASLPGLEVRRAFLDAFGILYVDLDAGAGAWLAEGRPAVPGALRAVVGTLAASFDGVRRVQLLVEGREVSAWAGGLDLRRPLPLPGEEPSAAEGGAPAALPAAPGPQ